MLLSSSELLLTARGGGYAVGAFNTSNLETTHAIMRAAAAQRAPVIVQISANSLSYAGIDFLPQMVVTHAALSKQPCVMHLDHGPDFASVMRCLRRGFTSVMRDASRLPFEENIAQIRRVVEAAHTVDVPVEAELGIIAGIGESIAVTEREQAMTDPEAAAEFVGVTGCDALAVSIGNKHGFYQGEPDLDFDRLRAIREIVDIPLVLHGASGIPDTQIREAIRLGVCKVNIDTEMRDAFARSVRQTMDERPGLIDPRKILGPAIDAVQAVVERKMVLFGSAGKG
jgi:fructose-bisphosphate aldolase class II